MSAAPRRSCFVISPFGDPFDEYYREIYRPGIEAAGLDPIRADEIFKPGVFMRDVVEQITSCAVALAELTGRNANVFYELGLAHALGKPVVLLAQQPEDVPADLRAIRWIRYDRVRPHWSSKLHTDITEALQAALAGGPSPVIDGPSDRDLARRLAAVSGTQKQILDHLRAASSPIALPCCPSASRSHRARCTTASRRSASRAWSPPRKRRPSPRTS